VCYLNELVIDRSLQTRNNLKILRLVGILPFRRDVNIPIPPLLLSLANLNPLLSSKVLAKLSESIRRQPKSLKKRTVLNRVKDNMVIRPILTQLALVPQARKEKEFSPSKVQHSQPINMSLVGRRGMHPMDTRFDQATRKRRQRITGVDSDGSILRLHPFPLSL